MAAASPSLSKKNYDLLFKVILIGDSSVGKTNLLNRFARDSFQIDSTTTIGVEVQSHLYQQDGQTVKVQMWSTAGQERYRATTVTYYRGAVGALLVYDMTRLATFNSAVHWLNELREHADPNVVVSLVGNKSDLHHLKAVSSTEAKEFADSQSLLFAETSALDASNVNETFESLFAGKSDLTAFFTKLDMLSLWFLIVILSYLPEIQELTDGIS